MLVHCIDNDKSEVAFIHLVEAAGVVTYTGARIIQVPLHSLSALLCVASPFLVLFLVCFYPKYYG